MNKHSTELSNHHNGLFTLWALINGQGSQLSRTKVKATNGCTKVDKNKDYLQVLKSCRSETHAAYKETNFSAPFI